MPETKSADYIPFSRVVCEGKELDFVREVLESGWLTTASKSVLFEEKFSSAVNATFACTVNSCTSGLHLALESLGIGPGDRVFVPTMTFTATAEVVRYLGADPVFLDVEYGTSLLNSSIFMEAIAANPGVKALMVVHYGGQAAPMLEDKGKPGLLEIANEHRIKIIEDAAHAFPARHKGRMVGNLGDITCFSFYANKTITTGEGGMVTTNDPDLAKRINLMRLHGIDRDVWNRYTSQHSSWEYDVLAPGFKYNMPDINAAIGLAQLEFAEKFRQRRENCARCYFNELQNIDCIELPTVREDFESHAWHLFPIVLKENSPIDRDKFINEMEKNGIGTSVHYKPLHRMTYYKNLYKLDPVQFPNAEKIFKGCVSLPIYPSLRSSELEKICSTIKHILNNN